MTGLGVVVMTAGLGVVHVGSVEPGRHFGFGAGVVVVVGAGVGLSHVDFSHFSHFGASLHAGQSFGAGQVFSAAFSHCFFSHFSWTSQFP